VKAVLTKAITLLLMMAIAVCLRAGEAEEAGETLGKDWQIPADKQDFHVCNTSAK